MPETSGITVSEDYLKGLERKVDDLKLLVGVSTIIASTLELDALMPLVMDKAKQVMEAEACSILFFNRETNKLEFEVALCDEESNTDLLKKKVTLNMGQGIAGWVAEHLEPLVIDDVKEDSRFFPDADKLTGFETRSIIAIPLIGRSGLIGVAEIINPRKRDYDPEVFQLLCRQFAISIENALLYRESLARERLRQELEIASALQKSFLPASPVFTRGPLTVSAVNISAASVGGDLYDFQEPLPGKVGVFIGDVSGKGISAALYMSKIISDFRYTARSVRTPDVALNLLNTHLTEAPRGMFLTAVYMIIDTATGETEVSVAGHPPCLRLSDGQVTVMNVPSGPPLGILPQEYPLYRFILKHGDRLLLMTDGLFDAKNRQGERIGFNAIVEFVGRHTRAEGLMQELIEYVDDFSTGTGRADDLTMVEVRWGKG